MGLSEVFDGSGEEKASGMTAEQEYRALHGVLNLAFFEDMLTMWDLVVLEHTLDTMYPNEVRNSMKNLDLQLALMSVPPDTKIEIIPEDYSVSGETEIGYYKDVECTQSHRMTWYPMEPDPRTLEDRKHVHRQWHILMKEDD